MWIISFINDIHDILTIMARRVTSLNSDTKMFISLKRDIHQALFDVLRATRLERHLSQQELARKLGVRQRQISDLERATMDPRLSTIQNVARALDLELMLIPRHLIPAVEGLQRAGSDSTKRPMYALDDDDTESDPGDHPRVEVGGTSESGEPIARRRRRPKEPR